MKNSNTMAEPDLDTDLLKYQCLHVISIIPLLAAMAFIVVNTCR